ncbi:hypothetical protein [Nocardia sp. NPDC057455]|uniref:hypothetical protein n=1 Tax=Nocardia sp. NPDC057455 TaxID=3346138 RepID=UPI0036717439
MAVEWDGVRGLDAALARGLDMALEALKDDAVARSPTESGELDRSAVIDSDGRVGSVEFTAEYAAIQERRRDFEHDDGGPGFLASALADLPIEQIVGEQLRREIGG